LWPSFIRNACDNKATGVNDVDLGNVDDGECAAVLLCIFIGLNESNSITVYSKLTALFPPVESPSILKVFGLIISEDLNVSA